MAFLLCMYQRACVVVSAGTLRKWRFSCSRSDTVRLPATLPVPFLLETTTQLASALRDRQSARCFPWR